MTATLTRGHVLACATAIATATVSIAMLWTGFFTTPAVVVAATLVVAATVLVYKLGQSVRTRPSSLGLPKTLRRLAVASLLWPVLVAVLLYGEWSLATWSLGHIPRPSIDDPKDVAGSRWMHIFTVLAVVGAVPAAISALVLNAIAIRIDRSAVGRGLIRIGAVIVSWAILVVLVKWDPGAVLYWWVD